MSSVTKQVKKYRICGNILGVWLGIDDVKKAFNLDYLEMQELILKTADELYDATSAES